MQLIKIWVINLKSRPDRLKSIGKQLESMNIEWSRLNAIDGKNCDKSVLKISTSYGKIGSLSDGVRGCTASHYKFWQEFISSGSDSNRSRKAFYHRMKFPAEYKCDTMRLQKFDKNHGASVEYTFLSAFPVNITPVSVSYDQSQILEISVSFAYDRYFFGNLRRQDTRSNQNSGMATNPYPKDFLDHAGNAVGMDKTTKIKNVEVDVKRDQNNDATSGFPDGPYIA